MVIQSNPAIRPVQPQQGAQAAQGAQRGSQVLTRGPADEARDGSLAVAGAGLPMPRPQQGAAGPLATGQIEGDVQQAIDGGSRHLHGPAADQRYANLQNALPQLGGQGMPQPTGNQASPPDASQTGQPVGNAQGAQPTANAPTGNPRIAEEQLRAGSSAYRHGHYAQAEQHFRQAIAQMPPGDDRAMMQYNLGMSLERQGRGHDAAEAFNAFLSPPPAGADAAALRHAHREVAGQCLREGETAYRSGNYAEAARQYSQALGHIPADDHGGQAQGSYNLARSLEMQGDTQGARQQYERFLEQAPRGTDAATIRRAQEQIRQAGGGPPAPTQQPDTSAASAQFQAGSQAYSKGQYAGAATAFRDALARTPASDLDSRSALCFNIARSLERSGDAQGASEFYRNFLASAPQGGDRSSIAQAQAYLQRQSQATPF